MGHFDGIEREFRGFGRVEQVDAEDYARFAQDNEGSLWIDEDWRLYQPPVKTVTWFHTGVADDRDCVLSQFAREYFPARYSPSGDFQERTLPEPVIETSFDPAFHETLDDDEWRSAARLQGHGAAAGNLRARSAGAGRDAAAPTAYPPVHGGHP